jgi:NAD(P)H-dependent FMN reductase
MPDHNLRVLTVVGSLNRVSVTRTVVHHVADLLRRHNCDVDVLDLLQEPLALYNPDSAYEAATFASLQARVERAEVYVLGTPDYHGSISSAMKNFLDHFWREFAGKLFATIVASHEKGLTVTDQLRTVARQCYAWSMPYGISFKEGDDVRESKIVNEKFEGRLEMLARDVAVYGKLLAVQRESDLSTQEPCFMARHRK